ncbi:hypothetical protein [Roseibium sp. SCP14]|uniref:hypothetical protein n=1 Tax=Roseibium sp. SCP14 TaxID=3141375 RepID=UPI003336707A
MQVTKFPIRVAQHQALTFWDVGPLKETLFAGEAATMTDRVNYVYINGFTDVGDLPCRTAFLNTMKGRKLPCPELDEIDETLFFSDQTKIDFSGFWHRPTHLQRELQCRIRVERKGYYLFTLTTCGGIRIWVNGMQAHQFEPMTRNAPATDEVWLPLEAGENSIVVHAEDLAERDTQFFFELIYRGEPELHVGLSSVYDAESLGAAEKLLSSVQPDKLYYDNGHVSLIFSSSFEEDLEFDIAVQGLFNGLSENSSRKALLRSGQKVLEGPPVTALSSGSNRIRTTLHYQGMAFTREVGVVSLQGLKKGAGRTYRDRCQELLLAAAQDGNSHISHALAKLHTGLEQADAFALIERYLTKVSNREDCSDFAFLPLLWIWRDHAYKIGEPRLWDRLKSTFLGYRYWIDEPGNDAMWFWSENHTLCFHASQYLAGFLFPRETFIASGRAGLEQRQLGHRRLLKWFDAVERDGLAEWNSIPYYPIDFIGLATLFALAPDEDIRERAQTVMNRIFEMMALHTLDGQPAGTMGRVYDKDNFAGPACELATLSYCAWGRGYLTAGGYATTLVALSGFEPSDRNAGLAVIPAGQAISACYTQGHGHAGKLKLFKTRDAQLSTVVDHKSGQPGHQQHVQDVKLSGNPYARFWINHPGEERVWGNGRPSYWSGHGVLPRAEQHGAVGLLMFDTPEEEKFSSFTHLFVPAPACDEILQDGNWLFVRNGSGLAAFHAVNGMTRLETGCFAGLEYRSPGWRNAWVSVIGSAQTESFDAFCTRLGKSDICFDPDRLTLDVSIPDQDPLSLHWTGEFRVSGQQQEFSNLTPEPDIRHQRLAALPQALEVAHV